MKTIIHSFLRKATLLLLVCFAGFSLQLTAQNGKQHQTDLSVGQPYGPGTVYQRLVNAMVTTVVANSVISELKFTLTNPEQIARVSLFRSDNSLPDFTNAAILFGAPIVDPTGTITFTGSYTQASATTKLSFYLLVDIKPTATVGTTIDAVFTSVTIAGTAYTPSAMTNDKTPVIAANLTGTKTVKATGGDYANLNDVIKAINDLGVGDGGVTFEVENGKTFNHTSISYNLSLIRQTGTATKPIVIKRSATNTSAAKPIINCPATGSAGDCMIGVVGVDYLTIDGLDFRATGTSATVMFEKPIYFNGMTDNGCSYNEVKNCVINAGETFNKERIYAISFNSKATQAEGTNNFNKIHHNEISNVDAAVDFNNRLTLSFYDDGNEIYNNTITGQFGTEAAGIKVSYCKNTKIYNNVLDGAGVTVAYGDRHGIATGGATNTGYLHIYGNVVKNMSINKQSSLFGITANAPTVLIYNNVVSNLTNTFPLTAGKNIIGINLGTDNTLMPAHELYHNSVYLNQTLTNSLQITAAVGCITTNALTITMANNIFVNNSVTGTAANNYVVFIQYKDLTKLSAASNNNLYYANDPASTRFKFSNSTYATFDLYKAASIAVSGMENRELNSVSGSPIFVNAANNDLSITNVASPANNAGKTVASVTTDILGNARHATTPDMGAYEFGAVAATPTISTTGTLSAVNTTYGTPSASPTSFNVSGANMLAGILVTPPAGYEVSLASGSGYGATVTVGAAGTISSTPVYVRLLATATVAGSPYSGNIVLSSSTATSVDVATVSSTVSAKGLTISGITGANKPYDGTTTASFTGTAVYSGLENGETPTVTGTPIASFANATAGDAKTITISGYTAPSANYTITQPTLSGNITKVALTITAANQTVAYGTLATTVTGAGTYTPTGFVNGEGAGEITGSVTYTTNFTNSTAVAASGISITPVVTGLSATNYSFTPANGTITITEADVTVSSANTLVNSLTLSPLSNVTVSGTGSLVINDDIDVASVNVAAGGKITINSGSDLDATLTLESTETATATLLDEYTVPTVSAIVKQHVSAGRNWYMSAPVSAADYSWLNRGTSVQEWNEATKAWVIKSSGTLTPGKGYIQVATSTPSVTGTTGTVDVNGTTNSGNVSITVSRTESGSSRGFNLVGNPYPSYLKWTGTNGFITDAGNAGISSSFWFRTKNTGNAYVFTTYNGTSHTVVGGTGVSGILNEYIPPMQAFWIRVDENVAKTTHNVNLTFKNTMRVHGAADNNKFRAPKADERRSLRLVLANGTQADESLIYFDAAAANAYDNYDSPKMLNNSNVLPDIYSMVGTERMAINGLTEPTDNMELPLGFTLKAAATGLKLKVSELSNFASGARVYLLDKEQNAQTELTAESEYTFDIDASTTNNESRFALLFRAPGVATGIDNAENAKANVYVNAANQIVIDSQVGNYYAVYNALGQQIENGILNAKHETRNIKQGAGVYVVRVNNHSTRVIIK